MLDKYMNTREIALTQGYHAIVDAEDYDALSVRKWSADVGKARKDGRVFVYAVAKIRYVKVYMHRWLLDLKYNDNQQVDHKNGNTLDNRRENLLITTHSGNQRNRHNTNSSTGVLGVYRLPSGMYMAQMSRNHKTMYLGTYSTLEAAEKATLEGRATHDQINPAKG